jgi:hypothetical protein
MYNIFQVFGNDTIKIQITCRKKIEAGTVGEFLLLFNPCSIREAEFLD